MSGFHPVPKPAPTVKPPKGLRKVNKARAGSEFKRCYHSVAFKKFVSLGPCAACGAEELCDPAHVVEHEDGSTKGAGYKGSWREVAPLCRPRYDLGLGNASGAYEGCHQFSHRDPNAFRRRFPYFNPIKAARKTQTRWRLFLRSAHTEKPHAG